MRLVTKAFGVLLCILLVACNESEKNITEAKKFEISALFDGETNFECKNIFLIKKVDCISCEMSLSRLISDSLISSNSLFINESIRKIERKKYIENRSFLKSVDMIYSDSIIAEISNRVDLKFNTSILIVLNKNLEIIDALRLRDYGSKSPSSRNICRSN